MDINEIMSRDGSDWTAEEVAFVEQTLLQLATQFHREMEELCAGLDECEDVALLRKSAASMLHHIELGVNATD